MEDSQVEEIFLKKNLRKKMCLIRQKFLLMFAR